MKNIFYSLPIDFTTLMRKNAEHSYCSYDQSLAQNLFVLITSKHGEHRFDEEFGCEIWLSDFQLIPNQNIWKEKIRKSIETLILKYEKRLTQFTIDIELIESEIISPLTNQKSVKKCLQISIKGVTLLTGENFKFSTKMFISPLSLE